MFFEFDKIFGAELAAALSLGLFNFCRLMYPVLTFFSYSFILVRPWQFYQKENVLDRLTRRLLIDKRLFDLFISKYQIQKVKNKRTLKDLKILESILKRKSDFYLKTEQMVKFKNIIELKYYFTRISTRDVFRRPSPTNSSKNLKTSKISSIKLLFLYFFSCLYF